MSGDKKLKIPVMAVQNLKAKKFRTAFMMFFVLLMTATFFFSTILMDNMKAGITNITDRMGADYILVPKEGTENIREALFSGTPCSVLFDRAWEQDVRDVEGVARVSSQLYIATLAESCCDAAVQLIAFDAETDFVVKPWIEKDRSLDLKTGEIVVGNDINADVGDTLKFYEVNFKVAAKLEKAGMGYDDSVFMTYETANMLKDSPVAKDKLPEGEIKDYASMLMIDLSEDLERKEAKLLGMDIQEAGSTGEAMYACSADDLMSGIASQVKKFSGYGNILTYIMVVSTALALISIFALTINERKYEFGVLYTLGASKRQITNIILSEALLISLVGGILGVLISYYLVASFKNVIRVKLGVPYLDISIRQAAPVAVLCIVIAIVTGIIAAVCSAYRISRNEVYCLIRECE